MQTHIECSVLIVRVLQPESSFLQLLPLVGQCMFCFIKLEAFSRETAAAFNGFTLLQNKGQEKMLI